MTEVEGQSGQTADLSCVRPQSLDSVEVFKSGNSRSVLCFCGESVNRSIVPHMKKSHTDVWREWVRIFVDLRSDGFSFKKIMRLFRAKNGMLLFSWTVIDREIRSLVESGEVPYSPPPVRNVRSWEPSGFEIETTTVWDFPDRGKWAVHTGDYRGNWPPQLVRNLILKYTKPGDMILDPFMGGGTTLIEAWLLGRPSIGIDLSLLAHYTTEHRLDEMEYFARDDDRISIKGQYRPRLIRDDATAMKNGSLCEGIQSESIKLMCVHPPYLNALKYTNGDSRDLSSIDDPQEFLRRLTQFAMNTTAHLASDGTCALLIGDVRRKGELIPLGNYALGAFLDAGYELQATIIKTQHRERSSEFYTSLNGEHLLAHEYLYIFKAPQVAERY